MSNKKKIIVSVTNDISTDQRVRKVCEFLVDHNFDVTLVGRKLKTSMSLNDRNYKTKRFPLWFKNGALFYASYNLRLFLYLVLHKADILLANDLDTLLANYWARKFKKNCQLIFDAHEYFTGVPELISRPRIQGIWKKIEKKTVPKVDKMYTVNSSIAELYYNEYMIKAKVVRNISDPQKVNLTKTRKDLGLPDDQKIVIMQGAGINIDRGGEEMIEAIQFVKNAILIFVGDGDAIPELKKTVNDKGWENKVKFFGKRPYEELMNFTMLSDVGVSIDKNTNLNYHFSLPNKIFDYIHAGIPMLVSDLPEIRKIVDQYEVGVVCATHNPKDLARTLNELFSNQDRYLHLKEKTKHAAQELTWQNECNVLEEIYCE